MQTLNTPIIIVLILMTADFSFTAEAPEEYPPKIPKARTYTIKSGETMASIARKQGVSLTALQSANPGVNPKKLRAGQTVNLP